MPGAPDDTDTLPTAGGPGPAGAERRPVRRRLRSAGRLAAAIVVVGSFAVWIYAFFGVPREVQDQLEDPAFASAAEARCAVALAELAELPDALDAADGPERAEQIRASTARLESMLDDLDALDGGTGRDAVITSGWLADWRVLVADRYRYADAIAADPDAQFLVTDIGVDERIDRRITRVANANDMPSCAVPGDVG